MAKKGQVSIEFLVVTAFMILLLSISVFVHYNAIDEGRAIESKRSAEFACLKLSSAISAVASGGNGSEIIVTLPQTIGDGNYSIYVYPQNKQISINYRGGVQSCSTQTNNFSYAQTYNRSLRVRNLAYGVTIG